MPDNLPSEPEISLLYVEDETEARESVCRTLALKYPQIRLSVAENGLDGLEKYQQESHDLVITDISMPVMDGIRMAKEIKAVNPEAIIIAMTAYNDTSYLMNSIEIGLSHYIMKPIDFTRLFHVIDASIDQIALKNKVKIQQEYIRKLSRAVEQSPSTVIITDTDGNIEYVNPTFSRITGYSPDEVLGKNPRFLKSGMTPHEEYDLLWKSIRSGIEWHGEFLNRKKNGELYWELASISPLFEDDGRITHYVAVKEDITERKQAEEEIEVLNTNLAAQASELEETNRELEAFSYSVSHDLCKPLTIINGYCQVILETCSNKLDEGCRKYLHEIYDGTLQMSQLINALLNFSRLKQSELNLEEVNLSEMAKEIVAELRVTEPQRKVTFRIADGVTINGDAKLLRVVLENLVGNAWKYTGERDDAVIEFGVTEKTGTPACFVKDNGVGFNMEDAEKLFIPFQRLPGSSGYRGHGIGLATVHRIIQRHGGTVWAEGEPGRAEFYFTLKVHEDKTKGAS